MENNLESKFNKLKNSAKLREEEKTLGKRELIRFMETHPYLERKPVPSPFDFDLFPRAKVLVSAFAFLLFFTTGLISSANSALPNQYLYVFKIKVLEPARVFLAWDEADRNETRVALINERLEDFGKLSLKQELSAEDKAVFASSFSVKIKEVQAEIEKLADKEEVPEALSVANDLQAVLSGHSAVLGAIEEGGAEDAAQDFSAKTMNISAMMILPEEEPDELRANINESIDTTGAIIEGLTVKLEENTDSYSLDSALSKQKTELEEAVANIESLAKNTPEEKSKIIGEKLSEVKATLEEADQKSAENHKNFKKEALNLYNSANLKLGELETILKSEKELGIDVVGGSEVEGQIEINLEIVPE